jgi:hypothetical protein
MPEGAEGLFLIPNWRSFAQMHYFSTYADVVKIVLAKLREVHDGNFCFENYREENMLCETEQKAGAMAQIADQQRFRELLIVPAQFTAVQYGHSIKKARAAVGDNSFGLGAFEVGIMLLTHPERIACNDDLPISCIGDELKLGGESFGADYPLVPTFRFNFGKLKFNAGDCHYTNLEGCHSCASAFLPK